MAKDFPLHPKGFHPFGELIGLSFSSCAGGESECSLEVKRELLNPHQVAHGAILYALADTGMGGALYTKLDPTELCATREMSMAYFKAVPPEGRISCKTRVLHKGRRSATLESELFHEGEMVAKALGSYAIFEKK